MSWAPAAISIGAEVVKAMSNYATDSRRDDLKRERDEYKKKVEDLEYQLEKARLTDDSDDEPNFRGNKKNKNRKGKKIGRNASGNGRYPSNQMASTSREIVRFGSSKTSNYDDYDVHQSSEQTPRATFDGRVNLYEGTMDGRWNFY